MAEQLGGPELVRDLVFLLSPEHHSQGGAPKCLIVTSENRNMPANTLREPPHLIPHDLSTVTHAFT